jgi:hypothetical protein
MPACFETSAKVPSPLFRKSRFATPSKMVGLQYIRYPGWRVPHHGFSSIRKST